MLPNHANKKGTRYRYYVSSKDKQRLELPVVRVPAGELESLVAHQLRRHADTGWDTLSPPRVLVREHIRRVTVHSDKIEVDLARSEETLVIEASLIRGSGETRIATPAADWPKVRRDPSLIKLVVRAHQARRALESAEGPSIEAAAESLRLSRQYYCTLLRLAYLAPDIILAILDGKQPTHLDRQFLARVNNLPMDWEEQRKMLGFA